MTPRVHVELELHADTLVDLPPAAARHVQVLRLQPGDPLVLFDGRGGEWAARVTAMARQRVQAQLLRHDAVERELPRMVTLAFGMPANDRMDGLVEKATELGVASVQPLVSERSVLRVDGVRAEQRRVHWQAVAVSACEQCGRNRVPVVAAVRRLADWLATLPSTDTGARLLLGLEPDAQPLAAFEARHDMLLLSGPEGGLSANEQMAARRHGFVPVTLGARVLRADTAPLAALAWLGLNETR